MLRPDRMSIVADARGWPDRLRLQGGGRTTRIARDPSTGFMPVLHSTLFHPLDDHYGLSPIQAAANAVDVHNAGAAWTKALLDNAARPSGALVYKGPDGAPSLSDEQFQRLKRELEDAYQGASNAGRPMVLEGGLDWRSMSYSPDDMDFGRTRDVAAREIALAFGVPPMLLGIPGDNTYANYREANLVFWRQTVLPLVARTAKALTRWLAPRFGENSAPRLRLRCGRCAGARTRKRLGPPVERELPHPQRTPPSRGILSRRWRGCDDAAKRRRMRPRLRISFVKKLVSLIAIGLAAISMAAHRIPTGVRTGDHLEPDSSILAGGTQNVTGKDEKIAAALKDAFDKDVVARAVVLTAFQPDYAVGIKQDGGAYSVFYYSAERCEIAIDAALGARLVQVWKIMLSRARPSDKSPMGQDGATFHFSMRADFHVAGGQVWSPPQGSKTEMLVVITQTMRKLCASDDKPRRATLDAQTGALLKQLQ